MYEMVNTLTNRKPVKIFENDDIFDKLNKSNEKKDNLVEQLELKV